MRSKNELLTSAAVTSEPTDEAKPSKQAGYDTPAPAYAAAEPSARVIAAQQPHQRHSDRGSGG